MDYRSRLRFLAEGLEGIFAAVIILFTWPLSRAFLNNWGSSPAERSREWPGDGLVSTDHLTYTRGISVEASAQSVWEWIVQFGLGRAGFYSYEFLERLVGIPVRNIESIEPDYQSLRVGDEILLHPEAPGIPVALLEPGSSICFGETEENASPNRPKPDPLRSWSMYIESTGEKSCRLILRGCIEPRKESSFLKRVFSAIEAPIDFIMEQRMLRTVKRLAEQK